MQPDEVLAGFKLSKPVMKLAVAGSTRRERGSTKEKGVAGSTRRERGSTKEKGYTPMVMGTAGTVGRIGAEKGTAGTVGRIGAEKGTAGTVGRIGAVIIHGGAVIIHGLSGKPAVAGKTRVWTSQFVGKKK